MLNALILLKSFINFKNNQAIKSTETRDEW